MAIPVGRIEREFLLKVLYDDRLPVKYIKDRAEYSLFLEQPAVDELVFRPDRPIAKLKLHAKLPMLFDYKGQAIDFSTEVIAFRDELIVCVMPEKLHKNLDRDYLRVDAPSDMKIVFTFRGDRYNLSFPKIMEYENIQAEDVFRKNDTVDLSSLIKQITASLSNFADGYKIVSFKDKKPETVEERIVSETGKALFLPSTVGFFPKNDPYPKKRIITEEIFKRYLESTGVGIAYLEENCARFIKNKYTNGIFSDAWIPILFHEYVIGYIHIWIDKEGRLPFDFSVLDSLYQFAKVLAYSLKEHGYFEYGKMPNAPFDGKVLDISASGLLFAYPNGSNLASILLVDSDLTVTLEAPHRTISLAARIVRRFKDKSSNYYGCRFLNMAPEDMRFLFEHIYGRQIDDSDAAFLSGQV
jgi:c-di-GMP-binding flagellar brake protein YcgR